MLGSSPRGKALGQETSQAASLSALGVGSCPECSRPDLHSTLGDPLAGRDTPRSLASGSYPGGAVASPAPFRCPRPWFSTVESSEQPPTQALYQRWHEGLSLQRGPEEPPLQLSLSSGRSRPQAVMGQMHVLTAWAVTLTHCAKWTVPTPLRETRQVTLRPGSTGCVCVTLFCSLSWKRI